MTEPIYQLKELLAHIGLREKEITIYTHLLARGPSLISTISRLAGLPRSTIYNHLGDLTRRGFVTTYDQTSFRLYTATHPENLYGMLENRYERLTMQMRKLQYLLKHFSRS